ncbi:MAG TPA: ABC transporter substrate-binding protein [Actinocrinis sp.]|nr:ABC transporter substrate-binding protein [Actinocrinis sp.]
MSRGPSTRALSVAVALSLVAAAAVGCSSSSSAAKGGAAASGAKNLQLIVGTKSDNFYVTMECGAQQEAKALGVNLTVTGPADFTVPEQKPLIDAAISTKPDALLVAPTDTTALDNDLQRVQSGGTKIVFVDTSSGDSSLGVSRITSNNAQGGQLAADQLAGLIGGKGTVAVVSVKAGTSTTDARVQGFVQEMQTKYPNIKLLGTQYDDTDSTSVATSDIEGDVAGNPDLAGVFAANVVTAEGAATAIQATKMSGKVKVATFDADPTQMTMLQNGTIQLAIAQAPAVEGKDAVDQAINALTGKPVTANILTPLVAITQSNMNDASVKPYIYASSCS